MGCYMSSIFFLFLLISLFFQSQFTYSSSLPSFNSSLTQLCSRDDYINLLQFKYSLTISKSDYIFCGGQTSIPKTHFWKEGTDCCTWNGVTCDKMTGHVIGLDLSCSLIQTTLHSNSSLFLLRHLRRLNLAYNDFTMSPIPSQIGRLTGLTHLNLSDSGFGFGQIPLELSRLSKLVSLDLSFNPLEIGKHQFESLVQNLTDLRELILNQANLSSIDPFSLKNLSSSLISLCLSGCGMHGNLLENVAHLPNLYELDLSGNEKLNFYFSSVNWTSPLGILNLKFISFSDKLWNLIGNLKELTYLDLRSSNAYGPLPVSLGNLTKITHLDISVNRLSGVIPPSLFVPLLTYIDLSQNRLSGVIPPSLFVPLLTYINLSENRLSGVFPPSLFLPLVTYINLSDNDLSGVIPSSLFMPLLTYIDLSQNRLSGVIPSSITNLTRLVALHLSHNKLAGFVPSDITWPNPNLVDLYLNDNELNGTLPSWFYYLSSLMTLDLGSNRLTGQINEFQCRTLSSIDLSNNKFLGPIPISILEQVQLTNLDLSSNNFSGRVNFEMFSKLNYLKSLDLSRNKLSIVTDNFINNLTLPMLSYLRLASCNLSEFPNFLKSLVKLPLVELDLSNNRIGGLIPKDMGLIVTLNVSHNLLEGFDQSSSDDSSFIGMRYVDLQSNMLQGSLPVLSQYMQLLSVANNKLSGVFPPSICNMTGLFSLDLSNNFFNGSIPPCLGSFNSSLLVLNLGSNRFHGIIPQTFEPGCSLQTFDVSENQLEGSIPRSLANCKELVVLNLGKNNIVDTFPFWLDILSELQVLILKSNRFHGPILQQPKKRIPTFSKLNIIDLSNNNFSGKMPSKFFERLNSMAAITDSKSEIKYMKSKNVVYYYDSVTIVNKGQEMRLERILTIFKAVDFSNNHFEGNIPKSIGNLKSLRGLNFSGNGFTGPIPSSLGNLSELESLDLSKNKLSGEIPTQLTGLTFLSHFDVSQNHLVGTIPRGRQFETFSNTSYEKNSGLCGPPLSNKCGNTEEPPSPPSTSKENQSPYKFGRNVYDWIVVVMGYVSGLVIGWVGGTFIFDKKKAWFIKILGMGRRQKGNKRNLRGR